jgi:hypothetical protein
MSPGFRKLSHDPRLRYSSPQCDDVVSRIALYPYDTPRSRGPSSSSSSTSCFGSTIFPLRHSAPTLESINHNIASCSSVERVQSGVPIALSWWSGRSPTSDDPEDDDIISIRDLSTSRFITLKYACLPRRRRRRHVSVGPPNQTKNATGRQSAPKSSSLVR